MFLRVYQTYNNVQNEPINRRTNESVNIASGNIDERRGRFSRWSQKIRESDRAAYSELFRAMSPKLVRYAYGITKDEASAYDVLQDVFLKLWEMRQKLNPESSLQSLLYTMTRNASLNVNRREGYLVHDDQVMELSDVKNAVSSHSSDEKLDAQDLAEKIEGWIQELPERRKEAFILSRRHEFSHREISEIMGLSERTVNTHIFLALKHLRSKLDALQNDR